jgi:hypothetical protein
MVPSSLVVPLPPRTFFLTTKSGILRCGFFVFLIRRFVFIFVGLFLAELVLRLRVRGRDEEPSGEMPSA